MSEPTDKREFPCPVCCWLLRQPPEDHAICPRCLTHFGYEDCTKTHAELRKEWLRKEREHELRPTRNWED